MYIGIINVNIFFYEFWLKCSIKKFENRFISSSQVVLIAIYKHRKYIGTIFILSKVIINWIPIQIKNNTFLLFYFK